MNASVEEGRALRAMLTRLRSLYTQTERLAEAAEWGSRSATDPAVREWCSKHQLTLIEQQETLMSVLRQGEKAMEQARVWARTTPWPEVRTERSDNHPSG